jgi:hypothetical protein
MRDASQLDGCVGKVTWLVMTVNIKICKPII